MVVTERETGIFILLIIFKLMRVQEVNEVRRVDGEDLKAPRDIRLRTCHLLQRQPGQELSITKGRNECVVFGNCRLEDGSRCLGLMWHVKSSVHLRDESKHVFQPKQYQGAKDDLV
jgi:hypothetical protein